MPNSRDSSTGLAAVHSAAVPPRIRSLVIRSLMAPLR